MSRLGFGDARIFDDPQVQARVKKIAQLGGEVASVTGSSVDNTDPANPIVNAVASVVAGTNVTVDATDPANPVVNAAGHSGVASVVAGTSVTVDNTDPANPVIGVDVGTGVNQVLALDGTGKVPAVDGSQITNLPAGAPPGILVSSAPTVVHANNGGSPYTPADGANTLYYVDATGGFVLINVAAAPVDGDTVKIVYNKDSANHQCQFAPFGIALDLGMVISFVYDAAAGKYRWL